MEDLSTVAKLRSYALALGVALSLALLQGQTCERGNTDLTSLEFEVDGGPNLIVGFSSANRNYDVSTSGSTVTVRAQALFGVNDVSWQWLVGTTTIGSGPIGTGSGEVTIPIPIPDGESVLRVVVNSNQVGSTASGYYRININGAAPATCNFEQMGSDTTPQSAVVSVGCTRNTIVAQSILPFTLVVDAPMAIIAGAAFSVTLDGAGLVPESILDAAQGAVCGGVRVAELVDLTSTVQVRSGATGADVPLGIDIGMLTPGPVSFCNFPADQTCNVAGDCLGGVCNPPILIQDLPVLAGTPNSPGGCDADTSACPIPGPPPDCDCSNCAALDVFPATTKFDQCTANGFCQNGDLPIEFQDAVGNYTADASGSVLWGWSDKGVPGLSICPTGSDCGVVPGRVDGCYQLPLASFASPTPPIGIRIRAGGLAAPIQCAMGQDGGTCSTTATQGCLSDADCPGAEICIGVGVDDNVVCPTPDSVLISCPIN